jgi:hypothetical protein
LQTKIDGAFEEGDYHPGRVGQVALGLLPPAGLLVGLLPQAPGLHDRVPELLVQRIVHLAGIILAKIE